MISNSTRRAIVLLTLSLVANRIVQTSVIVYSAQSMFSEADQDKQVIEEGSTLSLTCIQKIEFDFIKAEKFKWKIPNAVRLNIEFEHRIQMSIIKLMPII